MQIDLVEAVRQVADQTQQTAFGHMSGPPKSEDAIGREQAGRATDAGAAAAQRAAVSSAGAHGSRLDPLRSTCGGSSGTRAARRPKRGADGGDQAPDHRMQMEMLVRVAMIEREARGAEGLELGGDFGGELAARLPAEGDDGPERRHIGTKQRRCHRPDEARRRREAAAGPPPAPDAGRRAAKACAARAPQRRPRPAPTTIRLAAVRMPPR